MTESQRRNYMHALRDFTGYAAELEAGCSPERKASLRREAVTCDALMVHSDLPKLRRLVDHVMFACQ